MGQPSYGNYGGSIPRPKPTTWEDQQVQNASDEYDRQAQTAYADATRSGERSTAAGAAMDRAVSGWGKPQQTAMAGYQMTGAPPTQMASWMASLPAWSGGGAPAAGGGTSWGANVRGGGGATSEELAKFSADALTNFDPAAYGKEFAAGAYGDMKLKLGDELNTLQNKAVGAGRLRTGWLGKDQGQTVSRNAQQFEDAIARAAVDFSGQRLSAIQGGLGMGLDRARYMDANALTASEGAANRALEGSIAGNRLAFDYTNAQNQYGLDAWKARANAAQAQDELGYNYWAKGNELGFEKAKFEDTMGYDYAKTGLDAALERARMDYGQYNAAADRAASAASGQRDWASSERELADLRRQIDELKRGTAGPARTGGGESPAATYDPYANLRQVAKSQGVPFRP